MACGGRSKRIKMKNKKFKIALGLALLPLFTFIYFVDRAILVLLPWIEQKTVKKWFDDIPLMVYSVVRVTVAFLIWFIYDLIFG
jgi:uncharacterized membrane protein